MKFLLIIAFSALTLFAAENEKVVVAANPAGCIVLLKEKYGGFLHDTGTVVMIYSNAIWVTHRQKGTSIYPTEDYSILSVDKVR